MAAGKATLEHGRRAGKREAKKTLAVPGPGVPFAAEPPSSMRGESGGSRNVIVLRGGPSAEREVSLVSGRAVAEALRRLGHRVTEADIRPGDLAALESPGVDAVFIALHGEFGESGDVQALCEERGLAYTGSGPRASRLAMDKDAAKRLFLARGLATPPWAVIAMDDSPARRRELLSAVPLPAVVKPVDGGSSVDVVIDCDAAGRDRAMDSLLPKYGRLLVEHFVAGREMTVGILGRRTLPILEIIPGGGHKFYDYDAKYSDGAGTRYEFDRDLPPGSADSMASAALQAFDALGCRDMSRVDFMIDGDGRAWLLEVNTIPGFTSHSLLPMAAGKAGISFDCLAGRILEAALARADAEKRAAHA
jgi:D-alanine-D-alanine ligase